MIRGMIIAWAMLASVSALGIGLYAAFVPDGFAGMGLLLIVLSLAVIGATVGYVVEQARWRRRPVPVREPAPRAIARPTGVPKQAARPATAARPKVPSSTGSRTRARRRERPADRGRRPAVPRPAPQEAHQT